MEGVSRRTHGKVHNRKVRQASKTRASKDKHETVTVQAISDGSRSGSVKRDELIEIVNAAPETEESKNKNETVTVQAISDTDNMASGSSSLGPSLAPCVKQTTYLPQRFKGKVKHSKYVKDKGGYSICVDTFSDEDVSEETDDVDDTIRDKDVCVESDDSDYTTSDEDASEVSEKLSTALKIGKSPPPPRDTKGRFLLTFDGYHRKNSSKGNGGYGAMLRCRDGTPVVAVAGCSKHWISPYVHALEGIQSGLDLAIAENVDKLFMASNSHRVFETLWECFIFNNEGGCDLHPGGAFDLVCRTCLGYKLNKDEPIDLVFEIVRDIVVKGQRYYRTNGMIKAYEKEWNKPADFLSKMVRTPGEERKLTPEDFPEDLWDLVNQKIPFAF